MNTTEMVVYGHTLHLGGIMNTTEMDRSLGRGEVSWNDDVVTESFNIHDFSYVTDSIWDPLQDFIWDFNRGREINSTFIGLEN